MNKEKLKGYLDKVKTTLGKVSRKIWILIAVAAAVIAAAVMIYLNTRPYAALIDGATSDEAGSVLSWLQEQGVTDYRVEGSGTILVPEGQVAGLKARLLQEQYSQSNSSYSGYFERVSALSTQVDRERAWLLDLQERMEKTIRQFPGVRDVTVEINPGEDRGYVLDTNNVVDATASVLLTMEKGKLLTDEQANSIRNYVSHGVAALDVSNVTIDDIWGNSYNAIAGVGNASSDSALKLQLEEAWSNRIRTQVMQVLEDAYGEGNVKVAANATVELGNKTVNKHEVHLPEFAQDGETGGRGILGREFYAYQFVTGDDYATGGIVGTTTNADLPTYVEPNEVQAQLEGILKEEADRIYDNPTTDTQMIIHCGTLTDVTLAVTINSRAAENGIVDTAAIRGHAAMAAGIIPVVTEEMTADDYWSTRISVLALPFPESNTEEPTPSQPGTIWGIPYWVFIAAGAGLLLFVIVLTIILLVRRKNRKKKEAEQKAVEELLAAAMREGAELGPDGQPVQLDENGNPVAGANVMNLHTERSMELRQNIRDFVDENMEVAALLIKSWLKEDGEHG